MNMKKILAMLISLTTVISMFSSANVSAIEKMSGEQLNAIFDDWFHNYSMKTYTTDDWIYYPTLREIYSDTEVDEEGDPVLLAYETVYKIDGYRNANATSVVIPNSINGHKIYFVGDLTFKNNLNLERVIFSNGIGDVTSYTFINHKKLKKAVLPTSIKSIGSKAFLNCKSLKNVTLPKNIKIGENAFKNCKNIKFFNYKGKSNYDGESYISEQAFANCVKLEKINLGKANLIESKAFYNCKSLKSVSIPKNTDFIRNRAFYNCKSLAKATFKNKKKMPYIEKNTFKKTKNGIKFVVKNKKVAKSLKRKLKGSGVKNAKILIGKKVVYQNING